MAQQKAAVQPFTRDQMEELAKNRDNIVMVEKESKDPRDHHKYGNEFLRNQVRTMRKKYEQLLQDYPKYSDDEIRTKLLNCADARENSWKNLAESQPRIFNVVLKRFKTEKDKKDYDVLLKCFELEVMREKGIITTDKQIQDYWKAVGLFKDMCGVQYALEQIKQ
jgi:hypothetical protein